jgi:prephenate dehydrogenase
VPSAERQTLLIVGLGLIGGSIARALKNNPGIRVLACGRDDKPLRQAQADGVIDSWSHDVSELAPQADIILVATPTRTVDRIFSMLAQCVGRDTIITDAASVKGSVVADARRFFADSMDRVVPAHPIAGSEKSGYSASFADLYRGRNVILTPEPETSAAALKAVVSLWQLQGAEVHLMSASRHDEILAGTSHLPHLLAFDLVNTLTESVSEPDRPWQVFDFAAGGFADFSRIASSDAIMWRDIFLSNSKATASLLDCYITHLQRTRDMILAGDGDTLHREFAQAKATRDDFIASFNARRQRAAGQGESPAPVDPLSLSCRQLSWQVSDSVRGECSLSAGHEDTCRAIQAAVVQAEHSVIHGCEDSREVRDFIQSQIAGGALIAGPDNGQVTVYADSVGETVECYLPADPAIVSALAVLVAGTRGLGEGKPSEILIKNALPNAATLPGVVSVLQSCGLLVCHQQASDLLLTSVTGQPRASDFGNLADISEYVEQNDEQLLLVLALLKLQGGSESWQLQLDERQGQSLVNRLARLAPVGVSATINSVDGDRAVKATGKRPGLVTLTLTWSSKITSQIDLDVEGDTWLALAAMFVLLPGLPGQISYTGNIREPFPGLLALLGNLGLNIIEKPQ